MIKINIVPVSLEVESQFKLSNIDTSVDMSAYSDDRCTNKK